MSKDFNRVKREFEDSIELDLANTPVDVVVMGPNLTDASPAGKLRKRIISLAAAYGATIKPEHGSLIEAASKRLGAGHNLTAYEMRLVKISDVVVLIPESPGSLCELGLFSAFPEFGKKLLILANEEYPREGTYVADGPLTAAIQNQAVVEYVDYNDTSVAWSHVERRIEHIRGGLSMLKLAEGKQAG